jgi:hypothetical protein
MPGIFGRVWCDRPQYARLNGRQNGRTRVEESFYIEPSEHTQPCIRALSPPPPSSGRPNYRSVSSSLKPDISPPLSPFFSRVYVTRVRTAYKTDPPTLTSRHRFPATDRIRGQGNDRLASLRRLRTAPKVIYRPRPSQKAGTHTIYIFYAFAKNNKQIIVRVKNKNTVKTTITRVSIPGGLWQPQAGSRTYDEQTGHAFGL